MEDFMSANKEKKRKMKDKKGKKKGMKKKKIRYT
jgi:hypothetical protein